jgi:hypothetical protein
MAGFSFGFFFSFDLDRSPNGTERVLVGEVRLGLRPLRKANPPQLRDPQGVCLDFLLGRRTHHRERANRRHPGTSIVLGKSPCARRYLIGTPKLVGTAYVAFEMR